MRERLARVGRARKPETLADDLLAIGRRCAATLKGKPVDHGKLLYDNRGLPK
ncbi:MAG: type II toxin-antitoxin system VapB family antitoxin [Steroidobacteraceae bacterium]